MSDHTTYIRIDGEPFLSRAKAYREKRHAWRLAWSQFAESKGATGFSQDGHFLVFGKAPPPAGWTKADHRGMSHPKAKHPDAAELKRMRAEHPRPNTRDVYGDAVCFNAQYEEDKGQGAFGLGGFGMMLNGPHVGWAGDTFLGNIPDAEAFARDYAARRPEKRIVGLAATWRLPAGLTRITKAEYDLVFAQYEVEEERKAASAVPTAGRA